LWKLGENKTKIGQESKRGTTRNVEREKEKKEGG
jgi:hypothetical protein